MLADLGVLDALLERGLTSTDVPVPRPQHRPDRRARPRRARRRHAVPVPGAVRAEQAHADPARRAARAARHATVALRPAVVGRRRPRRAGRSCGPRPATTFAADWVIGADGASSAVRKATGAEFEGITYPERFLVVSTNEDLAAVLPGIAAVNYVFDPDEWLVLLRTPGALADPVPDRPGHAGRGRDRPGPGAGAAARRRRPRPRLGPAAHLALPRAPAGGRPLPHRPGAAGRRRRARQQPARRHGHEQRHPRRGARAGRALADVLGGGAHRRRAGRGAARPAARWPAPTSRRSPTTTGRSCASPTPTARRAHHDELRALAADPVAARDYLLRTSMIDSLRERTA